MYQGSEPLLGVDNQIYPANIVPVLASRDNVVYWQSQGVELEFIGATPTPSITASVKAL